ncbi:AfsR/SARP family transcriptional regulator [Micromonospora craterilacus]|uniref:AfsR/SARP family transcriptional regulator n=1 Tax=Micromonospora craterilacus TaxID=1655439 RepID=UPI001314E795|nr:BTAD domain-containing putative transcriptional regulator [Micromonospora craterilacus]
MQILGPLEVVVDGTPVPLGGRRNQMILAVLAAEANRVVLVDRLVDAVWDEQPPPTARSQIQICVSALRRSLSRAGAPDVIATRPPGYLLRVETGHLDADVFDDLVTYARVLVDNSRDADAAVELRRALGLWRGPALGALPSRVLEATAGRLEERRLAATEELVRIELALGRHDDLIDELTALVAEHPLRERLHGHLMLALYRAGRQAEALGAYRRARALLVEELGIEPGGELRRLEKAILMGSHELDLPARAPVLAAPARVAAHPVVPGLLPAAIADFTGRRDETRGLVARLSEVTTMAAPVVVVTGAAGTGKTATGVHVAHRVRGAFPDGQLYASLAGSGPIPTAPSEILVRFLRALGMSGTAIPDSVEERAELYRSHLADRRVLVVLDDVGDESEVPPLLPGSVSCRVLVTSRSRLPGLPGAERVELGALDTGSAVELLGRIAGPHRVRQEAGPAATIAELCGGLALALRIAGARLAARPHWRLARLAERLADETRRLDELEHGELGIRASLAFSFDAIREADRRMLLRAVLADVPEITAWMGAALADTDHAEAEKSLERLVDAQLLDGIADDGGPSRYRVPELVRVFARHRSSRSDSPAEVAAARRRFLGVLLHLTDEAHRREYGGDFTILHGPAPRRRPPQELVDRLLARPVDWLDTERMTLVAAVRQSAALGWSTYCWDLALGALTLFESRAHFDLWHETAGLALVCATTAGDVRGEAAMHYSAGTLLLFQRRMDAAAERLDAARAGFERCGDRHGLALVLRNLAHVDRLADRPDRALRRYTQALAGLRGVGDLVGQAHVLQNLAGLALESGDADRARALLDEALGHCRTAGARRVEAQVLHRIGDLALHEDDSPHAVEAYAAVLRSVRHVGDRIGEMYALLGLGRAACRLDQHDTASRRLSEALHLAREVGERFVEGRALHALADLDLARGRTDLAVGRLTEAAEIFEAISARRWRARVLAALATARQREAAVAVAVPVQPSDTHTSWSRWSESRSAERRS